MKEAEQRACVLLRFKAKTDSIIIDQFRDSIKTNDEGRYEVGLPWKLNHGELLDNKQLAERRLMSTTQRLVKLNEFDNYSQVFQDWLKEGIIEEVDDTARSKHFLSHFAVIKNSSLTTRVRPVYHASARDHNGNSLNSFLEKGVNCLELIPNLLVKLRKHAIGITSDIRKAFLFLRSGGKVWIILFTSLVYRAVPLELTKSLSTEDFLMALRRLIARRGRVDTIYTDNGTNIHGADNLLKSLNWEEITAYSSVRNIKWKFNPPAAPWWGGWWERLIRSLKELLRRNLGQRTVSLDELSTIPCDFEALMNSRPLTYIADDTENLKPLTPACFIQGIPASETPDLDQLDHDSLNRRLRYLHKLRGDLRERFRNEYLSMLIQKGKERDSNLRIGDVVLVETDAKRIKWPLGVTVDIYAGKDGNARAARVRTADGEYTRAYQRLYPLEVQPDEVL